MPWLSCQLPCCHESRLGQIPMCHLAYCDTLLDHKTRLHPSRANGVGRLDCTRASACLLDVRPGRLSASYNSKKGMIAAHAGVGCAWQCGGFLKETELQVTTYFSVFVSSESFSFGTGDSTLVGPGRVEIRVGYCGSQTLEYCYLSWPTSPVSAVH